MVKHKKLAQWIDEMAAMVTPDSIHICDGSQKEYDEMIAITLNEGVAIELNKQKL
ncbi:MAG TPA: hypothetical protein P5346_02615, partial [Spirochaetota bacterium]|nr:hypothetical protein [Spirochaetota bacterium]